jgi:hypothetical protein
MVFTALHPLEIRILYKVVKLDKVPILSWALSLLRYVTPNNGNAFTPPPLMWFNRDYDGKRTYQTLAITTPEYQLIRS